MEAKEKALELINQYLPFVEMTDYANDYDADEKVITENAKKVAAMTVNTVLLALYENKCLAGTFYWEDVKKEISRF